jgi:hypothetical protein
LYIRGAENIQSRSMGHFRQLVASPASFGFLDFVNCLREPAEETVAGKCVDWSPAETGEQSIHRMKSIS